MNRSFWSWEWLSLAIALWSQFLTLIIVNLVVFVLLVNCVWSVVRSVGPIR